MHPAALDGLYTYIRTHPFERPNPALSVHHVVIDRPDTMAVRLSLVYLLLLLLLLYLFLPALLLLFLERLTLDHLHVRQRGALGLVESHPATHGRQRVPRLRHVHAIPVRPIHPPLTVALVPVDIGAVVDVLKPEIVRVSESAPGPLGLPLVGLAHTAEAVGDAVGHGLVIPVHRRHARSPHLQCKVPRRHDRWARGRAVVGKCDG
mmetsp:Transcript_12212/g.35382  ORF Transcript_12212/g.35382 Transcript_12212/m.35382 type:complete len:206 (+) Transcript_12212:1795-2412(+)